MHDAEAILPEQFDDPAQQEEAATFGMWTFLATEVLFFGGLFLAYTVYRLTYPADFAFGSRHCDLTLGTLNTAVLLTSSLTMALALHFAQSGHRKPLLLFLSGTIFLALLFLALKGLEYSHHISDGLFPGRSFKSGLSPAVQLFFWLYFIMTGLHAVHVMIGMIVLFVLTIMAARDCFSPGLHNPIMISGLYWHFVDLIWIFLYPLFYLIR